MWLVICTPCFFSGFFKSDEFSVKMHLFICANFSGHFPRRFIRVTNTYIYHDVINFDIHGNFFLFVHIWLVILLILFTAGFVQAVPFEEPVIQCRGRGHALEFLNLFNYFYSVAWIPRPKILYMNRFCVEMSSLFP